MEAPEMKIQLRGVEKAAVLFLCIQEDTGSKLMRELGEDDTRALIKAISTLGVIPAATVESVIRDFSDSVHGRSGVMGSVEAARRMLSRFMPKEKVNEFIDDGPRDNRTVWEDFASLNEQVIVNYLRAENDQTVAAIIYKLNQIKPQVAASVIVNFGPERMFDIVERMMKMEPLPRHMTQDIEEAISSELLSSATRKSGPDPQQRMADMFNKMDPVAFEQLSDRMSERAPQIFLKIKDKMFTFDDLMRLDPASLQRIIRNIDNRSLAIALRGARKPLRDMFLSPDVMTQRARDTLMEDINTLGGVRASDAREAQNKILELTHLLVSQGAIRLPSEDDKILDEDGS